MIRKKEDVHLHVGATVRIVCLGKQKSKLRFWLYALRQSDLTVGIVRIVCLGKQKSKLRFWLYALRQSDLTIKYR